MNLRFLILYIQLFACITLSAQKYTNLKIEIDTLLLNSIVVDYNDGIELHILNDSLLHKSEFRLPLNGAFGVLSIQKQNGEYLTFLVNQKRSILNLDLQDENSIKISKVKNLHNPFDTKKNKIYVEYMKSTQKEGLLIRELYSKHTYIKVNQNDSLKSIQNHLMKLIDVEKMKVLKKYPKSYFSFFMMKNVIEGALKHNTDQYYLNDLTLFLINTYPAKFINTPETQYLLKKVDYKIGVITNNNNIQDWIFKSDNYKDFKLDEITSEYILIDFWATWCPPCMKQLPEINELSKDFPSSKLQIIGVNLDQNYSVFKKETLNLSKNWIHVFDEKSDIKNFLNIYSIPTTILLDKDRNIIKYQSGYIDKSEFINLIN